MSARTNFAPTLTSYHTAPHGGYLMAIFYRLARSRFCQPIPTSPPTDSCPISMQMTFLRRCKIGPALLSLRDLKVGANISVLQITLSQDDSRGEAIDKISGMLVVSDLDNERGFSRPPSSRHYPSPGHSPLHLCTVGSGPWRLFPVPHATYRKAAAHVEVYVKNSSSSERSRPKVTYQWSRLRWTENGNMIQGRWTNEAVCLLLDILPETLADLEERVGRGSPVWFPTMTLNVDFKRKLPENGLEWLFSRITTKVVKNGRMDIGIDLSDQEGNIIALAHHTALIMSGARTKKSSQNPSGEVIDNLGSKI